MCTKNPAQKFAYIVFVYDFLFSFEVKQDKIRILAYRSSVGKIALDLVNFLTIL